MTRPNQYTLGAQPEIRLATTDTNGDPVSPTLARLSIERPTGETITVSGGDMTDNTTYLAYRFTTASGIGFYEYEAWVRDSSGNEAATAHGFYISDRV
jgi:hypothetical protein